MTSEVLENDQSAIMILGMLDLQMHATKLTKKKKKKEY